MIGGISTIPSILVCPDHFAARPGCQGGERGGAHRLLHEADRAVAEQEIAAAGVQASIAAGARLAIVGYLDSGVGATPGKRGVASSGPVWERIHEVPAGSHTCTGHEGPVQLLAKKPPGQVASERSRDRSPTISVEDSPSDMLAGVTALLRKKIPPHDRGK